MGISTLDDVKAFLGQLGANSRYFSPGSSDYVEDPLGRAYIPVAKATPPSYKVQLNPPKITPSFTMTVWIKTGVRYETLIKRVRPLPQTAAPAGTVAAKSMSTMKETICYDIRVEKLVYGGHQQLDLVQIVNPQAFPIFAAVEEEKAWKTSALRSSLEDNGWHYFAVTVNQSHAAFFHDGTPVCYGGVCELPLPRPLTDCRDGIVTVGSEKTAGELVNLRWYPRILSRGELVDSMSAGKPLSDLLASSGAEAGIIQFVGTRSSSTSKWGWCETLIFCYGPPGLLSLYTVRPSTQFPDVIAHSHTFLLNNILILKSYTCLS